MEAKETTEIETKIDRIIAEEGLNPKHIYKCLKFYPFWQYYQLSPALLEILLVDNIERLRGNELSIPHSLDKEIIGKFTVSELETFLNFISHREIVKEINNLFYLLCKGGGNARDNQNFR